MFLTFGINFLNYFANEDKLNKMDVYIKNKLKDI